MVEMSKLKRTVHEGPAHHPCFADQAAATGGAGRHQQVRFAADHAASKPDIGAPGEPGLSRLSSRVMASILENVLFPEEQSGSGAVEPAGRDRNRLNRNFAEDEIEAFVDRLLTGAHGDCSAQIMELQANGVALDSICLGLLTPVAQRLGPLWLSDELSFSEISIALAHLQSLTNRYARSQPPVSGPPDPRRYIALARACGEQHTFGLSMAAEFFRLSGWQIAGGVSLEAGSRLDDLLESNRVGVLGLTAGSRRKALDLRGPIARARRSAANPDIVILLGGAAFLSEPDLAAEIGGDGVALDGQVAVALAEQMIRHQAPAY